MKVKLSKTLDCHTKTHREAQTFPITFGTGNQGLESTSNETPPMDDHSRKWKGGERTHHSNQAMKRPGTLAVFVARMVTEATTSAYPPKVFQGTESYRNWRGLGNE